MNRKQAVRICTDAAMTVLLLLLMAYSLIGTQAHEWLGIGMALLFIIHHMLNRKWTRSIPRGRYPAVRIFQTVLALCVLLSMAGSMVSGVILSRYALSFLPISGGKSFGRTLHMLSAYWGFVCMSLHLGFHWNTILGMAGRTAQARSAPRTWLLRGLGILIAAYGLFAFIKRDIGSYMLLKTQFVFFDFEEPLSLFLLDYVGAMGLFVWLGHYGTNAVKKLSHRHAGRRR